MPALQQGSVVATGAGFGSQAGLGVSSTQLLASEDCLWSSASPGLSQLICKMGAVRPAHHTCVVRGNHAGGCTEERPRVRPAGPRGLHLRHLPAAQGVAEAQGCSDRHQCWHGGGGSGHWTAHAHRSPCSPAAPVGPEQTQLQAGRAEPPPSILKRIKLPRVSVATKPLVTGPCGGPGKGKVPLESTRAILR